MGKCRGPKTANTILKKNDIERHISDIGLFKKLINTLVLEQE